MRDSFKNIVERFNDGSLRIFKEVTSEVDKSFGKVTLQEITDKVICIRDLTDRFDGSFTIGVVLFEEAGTPPREWMANPLHSMMSQGLIIEDTIRNSVINFDGYTFKRGLNL